MEEEKKAPEAALALFGESHPAEAEAITAYVDGVRKKNVVMLGADECFALRSASGVIRAFKVGVTLSIENGGLVSLPFGPIRSYPGYKAIADALGIVVLNPSTVIVDNAAQPNPYVRRDDRGAILEVYARSLAFGYTSKGVPAISDRTCIFDIGTYRMIDLLAKAKNDTQNFKLMPKGMKPDEEKGKLWACYPVDDQVVLWVNLSFGDIPSYFGTIINRAKKAVEFAQTFAQRNAIKNHPAVPPAAKLAKGDTFELVGAIAWRPVEGVMRRWDESQYVDLVEQLEVTSAKALSGAPVDGAAGVEAVGGRDVATDDEGGLGAVAAELDADETAHGEATAPSQSPLSDAAAEIENLFSDDEDPDAAAAEEQSEMSTLFDNLFSDDEDPDAAAAEEQSEMSTLFDALLAKKEEDPAGFKKALAAEKLKEGDVMDPDFGDVDKAKSLLERLK